MGLGEGMLKVLLWVGLGDDQEVDECIKGIDEYFLIA